MIPLSLPPLHLSPSPLLVASPPPLPRPLHLSSLKSDHDHLGCRFVRLYYLQLGSPLLTNYYRHT